MDQYGNAPKPDQDPTDAPDDVDNISASTPTEAIAPWSTNQKVMNLGGRALATAGVLLMMFAAYQVWGTAAIEWQAQRTLDAEFALQLPATEPLVLKSEPVDVIGVNDDVIASQNDNAEPEVDSPRVSTFMPELGQAAGRIEIPSIGLVKTFVEGTDRESLRKGPGHYRGTPRPGEPGNASIAGHRTTNGAPFEDLDQLAVGDEIIVTTPDGKFVYTVDAHQESDGLGYPFQIVDPSAVEVLSDHGDNRLTLTACHPKFSAKQRIVVTATLQGEPLMVTAPNPTDLAFESVETQPAESNEDDALVQAEPASEPSSTIGEDADIDELGWNLDELDGTALWATITALVAHAGWVLGKLWRRRPAYVMATVACAPPLLVCFAHLDRLLPAL